jgi:hypothetical protein
MSESDLAERGTVSASPRYLSSDAGCDLRSLLYALFRIAAPEARLEVSRSFDNVHGRLAQSPS